MDTHPDDDRDDDDADCAPSSAPPRRIQRQRELFARPLMHDLRGTQASILSIIALRRIRPDAMPEAQAIRDIELHARRALDLAEDLSRVNRALSDELVFEPIDLADALTVAVDLAWQRIGATGHRVAFDGSTEDACCLAHRELLVQALSSLIDSVAAGCPAGGGIDCALAAASRPRPGSSAGTSAGSGAVARPGWSVSILATGSETATGDGEARRLPPLAVAVARRHGGRVERVEPIDAVAEVFGYRLWLPGCDES